MVPFSSGCEARIGPTIMGGVSGPGMFRSTITTLAMSNRFLKPMNVPSTVTPIFTSIPNSPTKRPLVCSPPD